MFYIIFSHDMISSFRMLKSVFYTAGYFNTIKKMKKNVLKRDA